MHTNGNGDFTVDEWLVEPALNRISLRGETHYLRPQVMDLLVYLAQRNGQVVSTEELLTDLWVGRIVSHGTVYNCIAELRQALRNGHDTGAEIENIPKKGYRLVAEVQGARIESACATGVERGADEEPRNLSRVPLAYLAVGAVLVAVMLVAINVSRTPTLQMTAANQLSASQILFPPVPSSFPLVTDGARIYFNDWVSGRLGLRQMLVAGGNSVRIESPFEDPEILINPQGVARGGKDLMVTAFDPRVPELPSLWLWPLLDGAPRRIGNAGAAAFSPDGSKIAYTSLQGKLLIADADLQDPELVVQLPGRIFWPVFSRDGQRIRFSLDRGDGLPNTLWEVSLADGEATRLLPEWQARSHCCGSWTPDGKHFIFQAIDNGRSQIWASAESTGVFGGSGPEPYPLTRDPIDFRRPAISPAGDRIYAIGWQLRGEIVRYDRWTDAFVGVPELESVSAEWLAYFGNHVAFVSYPDATLWVSNSDGTEPQQLTFAPLRTVNPVWSPDGSMIAFEGLAPGREKRIFLVMLDTRQVVEATRGDAPQYSPTWAPGGREVAFNERGQEGIQLLDIETGAVTTLPETDGLFLPSWSSDGAYISALTRDGLVLYDTDSRTRDLIVGEMPIERHYWDRGSEHVFFYEPFWRADARSLYKVNIRTREIEPVTNVGQVRTTWGIGGMWIGPGKEDEPVLLRDLSIHHLYELELSTN